MSNQPAPAEYNAAFGILRSDLIDALVSEREIAVPNDQEHALRAWAEAVLSSAKGPLLGLALNGVPESMRESLRWAGMPLAPDGELKWDTDVTVDAVERPQIADNRLLLPAADILSQITSVAMRPLRRFVADRYHIRLQAATGISCYVWKNQALFISCLDVRVSGFVHGPDHGQRSSLALSPGEAQLSSWSEY